MNYSDRIVCFLDVLGFREHIRGTINSDGSDNVDRISSIVEAFNIVGEILDIDKQPIFSPKRITQFSDSIVISFPADKEEELFHTLMEILWIQLNLVNHGMLCRGAISRGKLMHGEKNLFGPAMVDAYTLETKAANYPRVILDQAIIDAGTAAHSRYHGPEDEYKSIMGLLSQDSDGLFYIDYITNVQGEFDSAEQHPRYLAKLANFVIRGMQNQDPSIRVKYSWLRQKLKPYLDQIKKNVQARSHELKDDYLAIPDPL